MPKTQWQGRLLEIFSYQPPLHVACPHEPLIPYFFTLLFFFFFLLKIWSAGRDSRVISLSWGIHMWSPCHEGTLLKIEGNERGSSFIIFFPFLFILVKKIIWTRFPPDEYSTSLVIISPKIIFPSCLLDWIEVVVEYVRMGV